MAGSDPNPPAGAPPLGRFREVCETHLELVWRFSASRGVEASALEQVVHSVFAIVHDRLPILEQAADLRVAIAGITRNVVRHYLRQPGVRSALELVPERGGPGPFDQVPREELEQKSSAELVDIILSQMSGPEREVFILHEGEGFSLSETAQALRIDEATLGLRLEEARKVFNTLTAELRAQRYWTSRGGTDPS